MSGQPSIKQNELPAPSDLKTLVLLLNHPLVQLRSAAPGRVVFDASTMFANRTQTKTDTPAAATSSSMAMPGDQDMFIFREEDPAVTPTTRPRCGTCLRHGIQPQTHTASKLNCPSLRWACPAKSLPSLKKAITSWLAWPEEISPTAIPMPLARQTEPQSVDPFGQDFDEEFEIEASDVQRWQARQRERLQTNRPTSPTHSLQATDVPSSSMADMPGSSMTDTTSEVTKP